RLGKKRKRKERRAKTHHKNVWRKQCSSQISLLSSKGGEGKRSSPASPQEREKRKNLSS
ncbi:hypothetical protein CSUI_009172, partial [Cystoisospora suis]